MVRRCGGGGDVVVVFVVGVVVVVGWLGVVVVVGWLGVVVVVVVVVGRCSSWSARRRVGCRVGWRVVVVGPVLVSEASWSL